jgi:hypothetical protein
MDREEIEEIIRDTVKESIEEVLIAVCDKFEDYMKNVDKLNQMINEFKGLVSIVRGESKKVQKQNAFVKDKIKKIVEVLSE